MVYVVKEDKRVELRPVSVQRAAGDQLLISHGLRVGETVVTDGQLRLVPGAKVETKSLPVPASAGPATAAKP